MKTITHDLRDTLEKAEITIYKLMCENLTNRQISEAIDMPMPTVKWHVRNICRKLGVESKHPGDTESARRRAILYSGTKIEQVVNYADKNEQMVTLLDVRTAAKKLGWSAGQIENLISFLEMENA